MHLLTSHAARAAWGGKATGLRNGDKAVLAVPERGFFAGLDQFGDCFDALALLAL